MVDGVQKCSECGELVTRPVHGDTCPYCGERTFADEE